MNQKIVIFLLLSGLVCSCNRVVQGQGQSAGKVYERPPNIILIMADDLGHEAIHCYGGTSYQTPRIDDMAAGGVKFNHCYSQPLCTPSRLKIMTGKSNFRNYERWGYLNLNETTFAHILKSQGYKTAIAGKWQLRGDAFAPYKAGFDDYLLWQLTFTSYNERYKNPRVIRNGQLEKYDDGAYGPQVFTDYIKEYMEVNRDEPFFIYYPMVLTHRPYVPTPDSEAYEAFKVSSSGDSKKAVTDTTFFRDQVAYMDRIIGEIIDKTKELGIDKNTLILFTSDNGTGKEVISKMGDESIKGRKGYSSEFGIHVPLIAYWNGTIIPGQINNNLIDFSDFLPTVSEAAGAALPEDFITDGVSFFPQLTGQDFNARDWIFMHYPGKGDDLPMSRSVFNKKLKLYETGEIYDIESDPDEQNSLSEESLSALQKIEIETFRKVIQSMN
ncbi:MAG: sulfatase-like hydrolase/transferase [Fulvivirga sp.]